MFTVVFWKRTAERAVKTVAQAAVALLAASGAGLLDAGWLQVVSVAGMAGLLSVLTSVASTPAGDPDSPSLVP